MGEFIQIDGDEFKIGTLEDLYYVTYAELRALVESGRARRVGGNLDPSEYLNPARGFRYRFPFPGEEGTTPDEKWRYGHDRGVNVPAPAELFDGITHDGLALAVNWTGGGGGLNYYAPCPYDPGNDSEHWSNNPAAIPRVVQVIQQKQVGGQLWTVVRCPYCGCAWRLEPAAARALVDYALSVTQDKLQKTKIPAAELCRRILAGYG